MSGLIARPRWLRASALALALAVSVLGFARAQSATYTFDIPAESLSAALQDVARTSGHQILFSENLTAGRTVPGLHGTFTVEEATARLLEGTDLLASETASDGLVVRPKNAEAASADGAAFTNGIETVLVTAEKRAEDIQKTPVPVTVVSAQEIANDNQPRLRDWFTRVPGLSLTPYIEGNQTLSIRGITTGGFSAPTVGIMIDDVPFGASTTLAGIKVPDIDPGDLARIEVLRGPQGTLYGADSMGGLLKWVTVDPSTDAFSARLEAGLSGVYHSSDIGYQLRASANIPLTDDLAVRVSGYGRQDPGYVDNVLTHENGVNEARVEGGRFAALWTPTGDFSARFSAIFQNLNADGLSDVTVLPGLKPWQQNYVPGQFHEAGSVQAYSLTLNYVWNDIQLTSLTGYNVNYAREPFDFTSLLGGVTKNGVPGLIVGFGTPGTPSFVHNDINKITQEVRASSTFHLFGMPVDWLLGGFYTHEHTHSEDNIFAADPAGNILAQQWFDTHLVRLDEKAVFGDLTLHFTDKFDLQLGARESFLHILETETGFGPFDFILYGGPSPHTVPPGNTTANVFTYLVTPRYFIDDNAMVYVRLASGYRPGGSNAAGGAPPSFAPDQTKNYEAGFKGNFFDGMLSTDVSLYYIDWKDIQIQQITPAGFTYESNGGSAKSEGAELQFDAHPASGLTLSASGTYDDAVLTQNFPASSTAVGVKGDRLTDTPKYAAYLSAEQRFPLTAELDGFVGADLSFVGNRIGPFVAKPQRQVFPSYTKVDLQAGLDCGSWLVTFYANNVGNNRGVLQGGIGQFIPYAFTYQQPRTIGVYVTKTF